ncbi:hypothetical protein VTO42DRAFT_6931 [Malbranchea cinnamomea]
MSHSQVDPTEMAVFVKFLFCIHTSGGWMDLYCMYIYTSAVSQPCTVDVYTGYKDPLPSVRASLTAHPARHLFVDQCTTFFYLLPALDPGHPHG